MDVFESSTENDLTDSSSLDTRLDLGFPMVTASVANRAPWHQTVSEGNKGDRNLLVTDVKVHGIFRLSSTPSNSFAKRETESFPVNPSTLQISSELPSNEINSLNSSIIPDLKVSLFQVMFKWSGCVFTKKACVILKKNYGSLFLISVCFFDVTTKSVLWKLDKSISAYNFCRFHWDWFSPSTYEGNRRKSRVFKICRRWW